MNSPYPVRRLSDPEKHSVHAYYDVCPESPDGTRLTWFEFEDEVPGPGHPVVADRNGQTRRAIDARVNGIGHVGGFSTFFSNTHLAWTEGREGEGATVVRDLDSGQERRVKGRVRQFSQANGKGFFMHKPAAANPHGLMQEVSIVPLMGSGDEARFSVPDAAAVVPGEVPPAETLQLQNTKWSPDGSLFMVVFTNEWHRLRHPGSSLFKTILVGNADGSGLRFLAHFGHHPIWKPDGSGILSHCFNKEGQQDLVFDPLVGERQVLRKSFPGVHATLHPSRELIVTDTHGKDSARIVLVDAGTWDETVLAEFEHTRFDHQGGFHPHPVFSRDGRRVYFNAMDGQRCGVHVADLP